MNVNVSGPHYGAFLMSPGPIPSPHKPMEGVAGDPEAPVKMGCQDVEIRLCEVQHHMKRVYSRALQNTLDLSHFFTASGVPLCRADLLGVLSPDEVLYIEQNLGHVIQQYCKGATGKAGRVDARHQHVLHTCQALHGVMQEVHQTMQIIARSMLPDNLPAERHLCDLVHRLMDTLERGLEPYTATPFLLFVALSQGKLGQAVVALMHHRSLRELAERATLVHELLQLLRLLCHVPDLRPILTQPTRFSNEQLSAWQVLQEAAHDAELFQQMDTDAQRAGAVGSSSSVLGHHNVRLAARQLAVAVLQAHAEIKGVIGTELPHSQPTSPPAAPQLQPAVQPMDDGDTPMLSPHLAANAAASATAAVAAMSPAHARVMLPLRPASADPVPARNAAAADGAPISGTNVPLAAQDLSPARPCSTEPSMCSGVTSGTTGVTSADGSCRSASPQHRAGKRPASTELDELNKDMGVANRFSPSALSCAPGAADSGRFGAGALLSPATAEQQAAGGVAAGAWRLDSPVGGVAPAVQQARERQQQGMQEQQQQQQQQQGVQHAQQQGLQPVQQQQQQQQQGMQVEEAQHQHQQQQQQQDQAHSPDQGQPQQLARSLSAMLHVSPPPALLQQHTPTASPHSQYPATPNRITLPTTPPPAGTPNRPALDMFSTGGYMQLPPPSNMDASLFEARSCSPSSSNDSKGSLWGTPSTSKQPSSPEYSTWGSPSPGGSPGAAPMPLPLAALSSRLAAMQAAGGSHNERGSPRSPLRRMQQGPGSGSGSGPRSPFGDPGAAFAAMQQQQQQQGQGQPGASGGAAAPAVPAGGSAATVEVSYYDQAGTTVSLLDPGYLRPDSPMRLEFPEGLVGSLASSGSVRSSIDALGTAVPAGLRRIRTERVNSGSLDPRVAGIQGRGSHLGTDSPGITTALAAAQLAAVVGATGNADNAANGSGSQPGTPGSGRDTAPQLDRRRHSRPAQASTLSRPPRRNPPEPSQDNDVAPGHVHTPAAVAPAPAATALGRTRSGLARLRSTAAMSAARASAGASASAAPAQDDQAMNDDDTQPPPSPEAFVPAAFVPSVLQPLQQEEADNTSSGSDALTRASHGTSPFLAASTAAALPAPALAMPIARPSWPLHCPPGPSAEPLDTWGSPRSDDSMLGSPRGFSGAAGLGQNPLRSPTRSPLRNSHSGLFPGAALAALRRSWDSNASGSAPGSPIGAALLGGGLGFGAALPSAPPLERMGSSSSSLGGVALLQESDQDRSVFGPRAFRPAAAPAARHRLATAAAAEQLPDEPVVETAVDGYAWELGFNQGSGYGQYGVNQSLDQGGLAALLAATDQSGAAGDMEFEYGGDDVQDQALSMAEHDMVDLVGPRTPLALLISRYEASSPVLAAKLLSLQDEFPTTRRVAGDGNCFYRAFVFALLEAILEQPDPALHARLAARVQGLWGAICTHMAPDADAAAGHALLLEFLSRVWYIAEAASAATAGAGSSSGTAAAGLQPGSDGASTSQQQAQQEQQGQQGPAMPLYVGDLEAGLRRREVFDPIIKFARLASSWELRSRPERYEPFLAGCGTQYSGLDLAGVCERYVERMGEEVEQLQVIALAHALDVTVGILDVAGTEFGYIQHPEGESPPLFWLVHCPGHYEIVYSREGVDPAVLSLQMGH